MGGGIEFTKAAKDVVGFEVQALDGVVGAATFDGGPFDDVGGGGAERVAHVGLLEDFFGAGTGAGAIEEFIGGEAGALDAVDDVEEAEFEGVGEGDAEIQIPWIGGLMDWWIDGLVD